MSPESGHEWVGILYAMRGNYDVCYTSMPANMRVIVVTTVVHSPETRVKAATASEDWLAAVCEGGPAEVDVTEAELWLDGNENVVPLAEDVVDDNEEDCEPPEAEAVGKDNDTAELAMLQKSCETFSAAVRSPGHWVLMHPTSAAGNVDPLYISSVSYCLAG